MRKKKERERERERERESRKARVNKFLSRFLPFSFVFIYLFIYLFIFAFLSLAGGPVLGFCAGRQDDADGSWSDLLGPTDVQKQNEPCEVQGGF